MNKWEYWRRMRRTELGGGWRWRLATDFVASGKRRMPPEFDETTRGFGKYLLLKAQEEGAASRANERYPHFAAAESAWNQPELRAAVQMLVLADVAVDEMGRFLNVAADVLNSIEDVYFDVRMMLSASHWIVEHVIVREADAGRDDLAARMRLAYFLGPDTARALIEARINLPTDPARQLTDAALLLHAKFLQAVEMPLTPEQSIEFIKLFTELRREEQRIQLEREKLAFRMKRWLQRCELHSARSESAQERSQTVDRAVSLRRDLPSAPSVL